MPTSQVDPAADLTADETIVVLALGYPERCCIPSEAGELAALVRMIRYPTGE